ncbi:MAG: antibiotic biosynthesis monooxygenase [Bryobacteraceae bacterium]|nr:antibiotic biosynthesis monooxygenase [Bryobacteraceae bacterium]
MGIGRRELMGSVGISLAAALGRSEPLEEARMYGIIGSMTATAGQRDALIAILLEGISGMPGCLSYVVAKDPAEENTIWITEVWDSADSHAASLKIPSVQKAIAAARPMLAGFGARTITTPVGGHGLTKTK